MKARRYIITGGPGAGKSSLLEVLKTHNYYCSDEVSRQLITEGVANGSECLPWVDLSCFAGKSLERMLLAYQQSAAHKGVIFFDRGIPDIMAYLKVAGLAIEEKYYTALKAHPYEPVVFILPPWKGIYVNDAERWQTFNEAVSLYTAIKEVYQQFGYTLIEVPKTTLKERVDFVLLQLAHLQ